MVVVTNVYVIYFLGIASILHCAMYKKERIKGLFQSFMEQICVSYTQLSRNRTFRKNQISKAMENKKLFADFLLIDVVLNITIN